MGNPFSKKKSNDDGQIDPILEKWDEYLQLKKVN